MNKITLNGYQFAYLRFGKGIPLVLLHGYPLDHAIWEPVIPLLEKDFDLIMPDLRGFGESDAPGESYRMADLAGDIAALLDALHIEKAAVAGHSMGGYVALEFTYSHADRLIGLGLVSSQALADTPEKKAARYQEADYILAHGVREVAEGMSVKLTAIPGLQAWLKALILRQRPKGLAGALRAMADRPDSSALLSGTELPLVLIHGVADGLIPVERARSLKTALPRAFLAEIPDTGHMPMMEEPARTAQALKRLKMA
jgi:3-oxoadipate enol-lactonase